VFTVQAEDQPSWAEIVRHAEHGESVSVIAHGDHVAEIVPSGELDRLRETIEVLSDSELVRDLREGLADARDGRVFSADQIAADLAARRAATVPCTPSTTGSTPSLCWPLPTAGTPTGHGDEQPHPAVVSWPIGTPARSRSAR
jgi:antitoxin (DNA-binding transcriptional repressor) of toxin-antitoxin stability system